MAARGPKADAGQNPAAMSRTGVTPAASTASTSRGVASAKAAGAPAKRQRVSRACDQCRAMRERCDGAQPQCSSCVAQNRPCTYKTSPKKRGVQTGYIRTLELTLSSLLDEVPGCAEALDGLFSRQGEAQRLFNPETGGQQDLERQNKLHRRWNKSRARREINRILSADGTNGSQAMSDRGSDDGTDTDVGPGPRAGVSALLGLNRPPTSAAWSPSESTNPSPMTAGNTDDGSTVATPRSVLALPPNHRPLLDIYFSYTHCWFPILERRDLLQTAHQCEREALDPTSATAAALSESSAVAELWAVMALASYQHAASLGTGAPPGRESHGKPHQIYKMARRIIPLDDGPFEIQHARALLILALINIGQRKDTAARMQVSMARQVAEESSSRPNLQPENPRPGHTMADAVLVGCCILDAMSAIARTASARAGSGLPTAPAALAAPAPVHATHFCRASVPEEGLDEWQTWAPCGGFSAEHAPSERGPAYSLSTFNQLHHLMRAVQQQSAAPLALHDPPGSPFPSPANPTTNDLYALDTRALDQAIRYDLPSSSFIRANDQAVAPVPSAYVVRIAFIWAHIILSSKRAVTGVTQSLISTLADVVEQFIIRFGAAVTPPILVPIVQSVVESPEFMSAQRIVQQRWHVLVDVIESMWSLRPSRDTAGRPQPGDHVTGLGGPVPLGMAPLQSPGTGHASPIPGQYVQQYQAAPPLQHSPATGYTPPAVAHGYGYQQTPVSPHAQALALTAASSSATAAARLSAERNAYQMPALPTSHPTAAYTSNVPPPSLVKQNDSQPPSGTIYTGTPNNHALVQPSIPPPHPQQIQPISPITVGNVGFSALPAATQLPTFRSGLDYDSLLNDLASADYLERLDSDIGAQFITNLGYVPGSDNLGAVMREYSGL